MRIARREYKSKETDFGIVKLSLNNRLSYIPLSLLYSSLLPLSLHLITSIWSSSTVFSTSPSPASTSSLSNPLSSSLPTRPTLLTSLFTLIPPSAIAKIDLLPPNWKEWFRNKIWRDGQEMFEALKREGMEENWMAVHLLAGMSSGTALRSE